jgi:hypothetical protein
VLTLSLLLPNVHKVVIIWTYAKVSRGSLLLIGIPPTLKPSSIAKHEFVPTLFRSKEIDDKVLFFVDDKVVVDDKMLSPSEHVTCISNTEVKDARISRLRD